jgi:hypothetical protein
MRSRKKLLMFGVLLPLLSVGYVQKSAISTQNSMITRFSDDFTRDTALEPGWTLSEPNPASSHKLSGEGLSLTASGRNGGSDYWPLSNSNATLLLRPLPTSGDWVATAEFAYDPTDDFSGAGIILTTSANGSKEFHRFEYERNHFQNSPSRGVEDFSNIGGGGRLIPFVEKRILLRIAKTGPHYDVSASADGVTWIPGFGVRDGAQYSYIGLIVARQPYQPSPNPDPAAVFKTFTLATGE